MNNKGKHAKQKYQVVEIYTVLLFIAFIFMSIGYAQISDIDMIISGQAEATAQNGVFIYEVGDAVGTNGADAANSPVETYFGSNLGTKVVLGDSTESTISYTVSLYNNSSDRYVFVGVSDPAVYDNEDIVYTLSDNMIVGSTILEPSGDGKSLDFTLTFKYKDNNVAAKKELNSILNFRFKELPSVTLNNGADTKVINKDVYAIYPGVTAYESDFIVENVDNGFYNKVDMKYTLSVDNAIVLPNGITESPLIVEIDNDSDASNSAVISNIAMGTTNVTHTYKLRVKWNPDVKYNSANYAGKNFKYKVNFVGTPTDEKYLDYTLNKSFIVDITTAPLNFNVNMTEADIFMEGEKASLTLGINNNSDAAYDTEYNVKVNDNTKFTPSINSKAITSDGAERTLNSGIDTNDVFTIDFAADVNDIDRKESVNVVLALTSPYTKEITIPVNIRSIAMSAKNVNDGNDATGTNAQVTNGNVNVTIKCDGTYLDSANNQNLQYAVVEAGGASLNESNWQTIATSEISNLNTTNAQVTKEITVNGNVYARYFDGTSGKGTSSILIDNIDKESPNAFSVKQDNVSTYSIKVSGSTTDRGSEGTAAKYVNINGYQYQIKNSGGTALTSWTPETTNTSYTFVSNTSNNLEITQGTKYIVSMRAVDLAGNYSEEASVEIITDTVADSYAKIGTRASTQAPTPDPVTVWFTDNSGKEDLILKYQIGSTSENGWKEYNEETGVSVSTNCVVNARLFDVVGQSSNTTATVTVGNIDKLVPTTAIVSVSEGSITGTTFTLTATGADAAETSDYSCSGVDTYEFILYDENGAQINTVTKTSTTGTATWDLTNMLVFTTYKAKVIVYDVAGNSTPSSEITFTTLDDVAPAKPTIEVSNIDKTTFTLTAKGSDEHSGIARYEFYINGTKENTITTTDGTATWDVTGKSAGTPYTAKVVVYDAADNSNTSDEESFVTKSEDVAPPVVKISCRAGYNYGYWTDAILTITEVTDDNELPEDLIYNIYMEVRDRWDTSYVYSPYALVYSGTNNSFTYNPGVSDILLAFKVEVADAAGNIGVSEELTYSPVCFSVGTEVLTEYGLINIEDIEIGMNVYTKNEITGKVELKPVLYTHKNYVNLDMCKVYVNGEVIESTAGHQYYELNKGWIAARQLRPGDIVLNSNNEEMIVEKLELNLFNGRELTTVYNLTIKDNHNYFVGENSILVHNGPEPC